MALTPEQQRGLDFEDSIAARGGRKRPGSGNRWNSKGDVILGPLLLSAKATAKRSWAESRRQLKEAVTMALGTGLLPGLAILDDDGTELVLITLDDLVSAIASNGQQLIMAKVASDRRGRADVPAILRDAGE